jgi:hypothetical protein
MDPELIRGSGPRPPGPALAAQRGEVIHRKDR